MIRRPPGPRRAPAALAALLLLALLLAGCGLGSTVTDYIDSKDTGLRKRVAVAPFTSGVASLKPQAAALQQAISQHLAKTGGVVVVDFALVQEEMKKVARNITNPEDRAMEAGRQLGINAMLAGNISDLSVQRALKGIYGLRENRPYLNLEAELRLVDVTTGIVMGQEAFTQQQPLDDMAAEAMEGGGQPDEKLLSKPLGEITKETSSWVSKHVSALAWGGTVLEVEGQRVLVSVGRDTGLPKGSVLSVYALGERIKAGTGQQLALPGPRVGRVKLSELGARASWAEIIERASQSKEAKEAAEKAQKAKEAAAKEGKDPKLMMEDKPAAPDFEVGQWVRTR